MTTELLTQENQVLDAETLYRAVRNDSRFLTVDAAGRPRISSMAFNDAGRRPSVDRAALCPGGLGEMRNRFSPGSGVLALMAGEVRTLTTTHGGTGAIYGVDVEPVPLLEIQRMQKSSDVLPSIATNSLNASSRRLPELPSSRSPQKPLCRRER